LDQRKARKFGSRDHTIQLQNAILLLQVATRILERAGFLKTCCSSMQGGMNRKSPGNRTRHLFFHREKSRPYHIVFALECSLIRNQGGFEFQDPVHGGPDFAEMVRVLPGSQAQINQEDL